MKNTKTRPHSRFSITIIVFSLLFGSAPLSFSQSIFDLSENILFELFNDLAVERNDLKKRRINENIKKQFNEVLCMEGSMQHPFDTLKQALGVITSPDKLVRVYTWAMPLANGTYEYYGFVQYFAKKYSKTVLLELTDRSATIENPFKETVNHENWYGALYYDIVPAKYKGKQHYLLLGWDGNDMFTNKKIIEPVVFSSSGKPRFGAPVFKLKKGKFRRVIFEYSTRASMALKYDTQNKMIIFDHLAPAEPQYEGNYRYYGPDFSYDGFTFKKGKWWYIPTVDARNPGIKNRRLRKKLIPLD